MWSATGLGSFTESTCGCLVCVEAAVTTVCSYGASTNEKRRSVFASSPPHVDLTPWLLSARPNPLAPSGYDSSPSTEYSRAYDRGACASRRGSLGVSARRASSEEARGAERGDSSEEARGAERGDCGAGAARRGEGEGKRRATRVERAANAGGCVKACMAVGLRRVASLERGAL